MGNSSGKAQNDSTLDDVDRTYPLSFNVNSPNGKNLIILYDNISTLYAENIIKSLGALPLSGDYTIVLRHIKTSLPNEFIRFSKFEHVYKASANQTENDGTDETPVVPPIVPTTTKQDGIVTIYSTVFQDIAEADGSVGGAKGSPVARLTFTPQDNENVPKLFLQITDKEDRDIYHDGQISTDWSKLSAPSEASSSSKPNIRLFNEDQATAALVFSRERYAVNSQFKESSKFIVTTDAADWSSIGQHLRTIGTRNGIYAIYSKRPRSKFLQSAMEYFANFYATQSERQYKNQTNYFIYNYESMNSGQITLGDKVIDMTAKDSVEFKSGVDFNYVDGKVYPRNMQVGYTFSTPFIPAIRDNVTQIFEKVDPILSTSSFFDYYHGTISLKGSNNEAQVLGTILNLRTNPVKKFTYWVEPAITDANTLQIIKDSDFLTYKGGYLTNIKDFGDGVNVLADKGKFLTLRHSTPWFAGHDMYVQGSKLFAIRNNLKPIKNPFFGQLPKTEVQGYFVPAPSLVLPKSMLRTNYINVLISKNYAPGPLWNFGRLASHLFVMEDNKSLNVKNWLFIVKSSDAVKSPLDEFKVLSLGNDFYAIYPAGLLTWNKLDIAVAAVEKGLSITVGGLPRYIFYDKIPPNFDQYKEAAVFSDAKESPGRNFHLDVNSELFVFMKQSYNLSQIVDSVTGGPVNPLILSLSTAILTAPEVTNNTIIKRADLRCLSVIRNLKKDLAPAYIELFESYYKINRMSIGCSMFFAIDAQDFTDELKRSLVLGRSYTDTARKVVIVYYLNDNSTYEQSTHTLSSRDFPDIVFNSTKAAQTTIDSAEGVDLKLGRIYVENFENSNDVLNNTESVYTGTATFCYLYDSPFVTYNGAGFAVLVSNKEGFYASPSDVKGLIRGGPNYICCTAIKERCTSIWAILRAMKDANRFMHDPDKGDFMLLLRPEEEARGFAFPAMASLLKKFFATLTNEIKELTSGFRMVSSATTVVVKDKIVVLNVTLEVTEDLAPTSSSATYNPAADLWQTNNPGFGFNTLGWNDTHTFNQLTVFDPRVNVSVVSLMTDVTPVVSFVVLQDPSDNELRYLSNLYVQFKQMKHLVIVVLASRDLVPNLPNVDFKDGNLFMYDRDIFTPTSQKRVSEVDEVNYKFQLTSSETQTFMKFGIFRDKYTSGSRDEYRKDLDFIVNHDRKGTAYSGGVFIDTNDRVTSTTNLYSFRNIDATQAPVFYKFTREVNNYIMFLRPIPKEGIVFPKTDKKLVVLLNVTSSVVTSYDIFELITIVKQVEIMANKRITAFYINSLPVANKPSRPITFTISDIAYASTDLYTINTQLFAYPTPAISAPYYNSDPTVPFYYNEQVVPKELPVGATAVIFSRSGKLNMLSARGKILSKFTFNVSKLKFEFSFLASGQVHR